MVSTDGVASFAAFIYSNDSIRFIQDNAVQDNAVALGFDAGDQEKATNLAISEGGAYIYRIEGESDVPCMHVFDELTYLMM